MASILLAYSATAYLFSGSVCYLASFNDANPDREGSDLKRNASKLASLWIALLWPLWMVKETYSEGRENQTMVNPPKLAEYSAPRRELISTGARESR